MFKLRVALLTAVVAVAGTGLAGCSSDRWCEIDATDTKVADRFCEQGLPGYEWEPDSDKKVKKSKKRSKSTSTSKSKSKSRH